MPRPLARRKTTTTGGGGAVRLLSIKSWYIAFFWHPRATSVTEHPNFNNRFSSEESTIVTTWRRLNQGHTGGLGRKEGRGGGLNRRGTEERRPRPPTRGSWRLFSTGTGTPAPGPKCWHKTNLSIAGFWKYIEIKHNTIYGYIQGGWSFLPPPICQTPDLATLWND